MMFQSKIDRAFSHFKEKHGEIEEREDGRLPEGQPEEMPLEKGDLLAMFVSAVIVIVPIALVTLVILGIIGYLFFFH